LATAAFPAKGCAGKKINRGPRPDNLLISTGAASLRLRHRRTRCFLFAASAGKFDLHQKAFSVK